MSKKPAEPVVLDAGVVSESKSSGPQPVKVEELFNHDRSRTIMHHAWPALGEHLWGKWQNDKPMPKATQYRTCVHPDCNEVERREAPVA